MDIQTLNSTYSSGKAARTVYRNQTVSELKEKHPMLLTCDSIEELKEALTVYRLSLLGMGKMIDSSSFYLTKYIREHIHYIYIKPLPSLRELLKDDLVKWTDKPSARCFFSPKEFGDYLRSVSTVTIETVAVPLSLFTANPREFRHRYHAEKMSYLADSDTKSMKAGLKPFPNIRQWGVYSLINDEGKELIEAHYSRVRSLYEEQDVNKNQPDSDVKYPQIEVRLPEGVFPMLKRRRSYLRDINSASSSMCRRFSRNRGLADVVLRVQDNVGTRLTCPGVLIGDRIHWPDFGLGATVPIIADIAKEKWGATLDRMWQFCASQCITPASGLIEQPIENYWTDESGLDANRMF